jgi:DNA (cytosine-5)-methyltransferase 1
VKQPLTIGSLFSGVGGLELGLEHAGLGPVIWQAESDSYCREVLARHWPGVRRYEDVREIDETAERPAVICGGFPCQDISRPGARAGISGTRSGLWDEFARIVRVLRPRYVVVENVAALLDRDLGRVLGDLASLRYDAEWSVVSACSVGAPHTRERLFIVAYHCPLDGEAGMGDITDRETQIQGVDGRQVSPEWLEGLPSDGGSPDGFPPRLDRPRVEAMGNAVVPQVAELVGRRIRLKEPE